MDFVAIDVETANPNMASICQIGIACYRNGILIHEWQSLINPRTHFDPLNIRIHGITSEHVLSAPDFKDAYPTLVEHMQNQVCVSHTPFDRVSIQQAKTQYQLPPISGIQWLDSARVARRTWQECSRKGYGLANVASIIGHKFKHHDALEDAKAAGAIMIAAIVKTEMSLEKWLRRVERRIKFKEPLITSAEPTPNPDGQLFGQSVVFTGQLTIPRTLAARMAMDVGLEVTNSVSKKTDFLVVGDQDITKLAGRDKSTKHVKAEKLMNEGFPLRIIGETDFCELIDSSDIEIS